MYAVGRLNADLLEQANLLDRRGVVRRECRNLRLAQRDFRASYRENIVRTNGDARFGKFEIGLLHGDERVLQSAIRVGSKRGDVLLRHVRSERFRGTGDVSVGSDTIRLGRSRLHQSAGIDPIVQAEIIARLQLIRANGERASRHVDLAALLIAGIERGVRRWQESAVRLLHLRIGALSFIRRLEVERIVLPGERDRFIERERRCGGA